MKALVKVEEIEGEGLLAFLGKPITLFCTSYIYTGTLVGVNDAYVKLDDAAIVYETGELTAKAFKLVEKLPGSWYVQLGQLESFGPGKAV